MKKLLILLSVCWLWTCSKDSKSPSEPEQPPIVVNLTSLNGQAQKGPFNNGTAINVAELSNTLSPTGRNFSSSITDNTGRFAVANVQLESPYVELRANGYYFNEVKNEISSGQLTLFALSNLTGKTSLNVNILTHLEKNRMVTLMSGESPKTFAQAKLQAQEEVLAIFDYSRANVPESELLDISQGGAANAKLLAMSAIIQGDLTVGQMSQLLANISTDIASDGKLDDTNLRNTLIENSKNLDLAKVRSNLVAHYTSLGISASIADFESEVNQFLKPPVVQDMSVSTEEDTPINITLAGSDPEGESLTYSIIERNNATLSLNGNVVTYTPNANYNGTDTFTYKANDGTSDSNTGTVTITVGAVDDDPNTQDIDVTTDEDVTIAFTLTAEEYDGQSYSFSLRSQPTNGSVSLSGNTATYTPNQDYNGTDSFTFEATDDRLIVGVRNVATATITVNAVNDAPVANDITNQVTDENRMMQLEITLDATDIDGDDLTYRIVSTNNGSVTINNNIATYVPTQDWNGEDTFSYVANDGSLDSNTATVTITVNSVNDAPVISNSSFELDEDSTTADGIEIGHSFVTDVDETTDGSIFSGKVILVTAPENGSLSQIGGTVILDVGSEVISGNSVKYQPHQNYNGTDSFTWKANDGLLDSNIATVTLTVNPVNDPPISTNASASTDEDINLLIDLTSNISDVDDPITDGSEQPNKVRSIISSLPSNGKLYTWAEGSNSPENLIRVGGSFQNSGGVSKIWYTPNTNWNGSDTFTFKANDQTADGNTATVTITVNAVNDAPVATGATDSGLEDTRFYAQLNATDFDDDVNSLSYYIVSLPENVTLCYDTPDDPDNDDCKSVISEGGLSPSAPFIIPDANWNGTTTFTWKANDGTNDSNVATNTIGFNPVNDAPVANNVIAQMDENRINGRYQPVNVTLEATDVEGDDLTYILVSEGNDGTAGITNDVLTYTPNQDWNGTTTLLYKANDGSLDSNNATVTITVNSVNDAPVTTNITQTQDEDNSEASDLSSFTSDVDGDDLTYSIVTDATNGTTSIDGSIVTYTPNANFHGTDSYTYKANDDTIDSNIATATITVNPVNDAPTVADIDAGEVRVNDSIEITLQGSDVDNDTLTYSILGQPTNGMVSINGSIATYTATIAGEDSFTYQASDGTESSNEATIHITVKNWYKTYGGTNDEYGNSVIQTSDGGYLLGGTTSSFGNGSIDFYLVKTDATGTEEWSNTFGGASSDISHSLIQTSDGGYLLGGRTNSFGNGNYDMYLVKTDVNGSEEWSKTFGGTASDVGYSVIQSSDGGYLFLGETESFGNGSTDMYLVKTDANGNEEWSKTYGGTQFERGWSVLKLLDGGYLLGGYTGSFGNGAGDMYLVKTDATGLEEWSNTFGGTDLDIIRSAIQTSDGGYLLGGYTASFGNGNYDMYLVKTDANGTEEWSNTFGGTDNEEIHSVIQSSDGGYLLGGYTGSFGNGNYDMYLVKTDANGLEEWSNTFGGTLQEYSDSVIQTSDGGYLLVGRTTSFGNGNYDMYLVKTDSDGY